MNCSIIKHLSFHFTLTHIYY